MTSDPPKRLFPGWQYTVTSLARHEIVVLTEFNQLGAEGWELVAIRGFTAYFKRPLIAPLQSPLTETPETSEDPQNRPPEKNRAAVELGRSGGLKGGAVRAARMTPEERSESARLAARARWQSPCY